MEKCRKFIRILRKIPEIGEGKGKRYKKKKRSV